MQQWKHNERASEPEIFDEKVRAVCECYAQAQQLRDEQGVHVISTDEKTSIQALERLHPPLPMQPGKRSRELQEYEYIRHGTRCLIANFEVATGRVIAPSIGQSRTNEDFASHNREDLSHRPRRWLGLRGRPTQHPPVGDVGQAGRKGVGHRTRSGQ